MSRELIPAVLLIASQITAIVVLLALYIGWQPLEPGAYLHVEDDQATEVLVVGIPQAGAAVLLMGW